jgi:PAS domain S-box-containing protein
MAQNCFPFSDAVSRALLVSAPEAILVVNRGGLIVLVNSQTEKLLRYGHNQLLGIHLDVLLPDLFRAENLQKISAHTQPAAQRPPRIELQLSANCNDGRQLPLSISVCSVNVEGGPLVCCVLQKVADPSPSDRAFRETCERFRLIVENSHDVLCIRDADGKVRYASPSIQRVLGYSQEQMIGGTGFELLHPDDRPAVESAMQEFWKNPGARGSLQYRALHANGSWVSLEVVAYNLLDDPDIRGVVINGRDITARNPAEFERSQSPSQLQNSTVAANAIAPAEHLPVCASCKKINQPTGHWQQIEAYVRDRFQVEFSHGMCPECSKLWYPDLVK